MFRLVPGALLLLASGCVCGALDPASRFACETSSDCGAGWVCVARECLPESSVPVDAGQTDAGVDADDDGYPLPIDCDDTNRTINPGTVESCSNGIDDNCNGDEDCADIGCTGLVCAGTGTCSGGVCLGSTEVRCDDGIDNDGDALIDCADSDCPQGATCNDGNRCTMSATCGSDGGCVARQDTGFNARRVIAACRACAPAPRRRAPRRAPAS